MTRPPALAALALLLAALAAPAAAVGLGPLVASGITGSERKGFYLTLINPYPAAHAFRLYAVGLDDEDPRPRVHLPVDRPVLGAGGQRRVLAIATGLQPGERFDFRVCAERVAPDPKEFVHARVCAKLSARRVA